MHAHNENQPGKRNASAGEFTTGRRHPTQPNLPPVLTAPPTPLVLLKSLRRRLAIALLLGVTLALVSGTATWFLAPTPKHSVRTVLRVPPPSSYYGLKTNEERMDLASHQQTQKAMCRSRLVLNSALRDPEVANLPLILDQIEPVAWLEKEIQVDFSIAPDIMKISLNGMETDQLRLLVNAVRRAYLREVVDKERSMRRERHSHLGTMIQRLEEELKAGREASRGLEEQLGSKSAELRARMVQFLDMQLGSTQSELLRAQRELAQAKVALEVLREQETKKRPLQISDISIKESIRQDQEILTLEGEITTLEGWIAQTQARSAKGDRDPAIVKYRNEISTRQSKIAAIEKRLYPEIKRKLEGKAQFDLQKDIAVQEGRVASLESTIKALEPEVERLRNRVVDFSKKGIKLDNFREDISHLEEMTRRLKSEYEALKIELQAPSRVDVLEEGTISRADANARRFLMTGGAALAAFLAALAGVAFLEYRMRRVDSVDEVVVGLGLRLLGTLPSTSKVSRQDPSKKNSRQDVQQQILAESVDAARTLLLHLAKSNSLRTVMITSAVAGEGKTSLSCHLAASLARAGLRTLLIDGDTRNPTAHRLFGIPCEVGFCEVLTGKAEHAACIRPTALRGLSLLPAGNWNDQVIVALNQRKPGVLFEQLKKEYDIIVIDSSPVLPVADALLIGQQVDGVLLSVLCQISRLNNLYLAWQRIEELGIKTLGTVVSGVQGNLYGSTYNYPYPRKRKVKA